MTFKYLYISSKLNMKTFKYWFGKNSQDSIIHKLHSKIIQREAAHRLTGHREAAHRSPVTGRRLTGSPVTAAHRSPGGGSPAHRSPGGGSGPSGPLCSGTHSPVTSWIWTEVLPLSRSHPLGRTSGGWKLSPSAHCSLTSGRRAAAPPLRPWRSSV